MPPDKPILDRDSDDDSVSSLALSELEITPSRSRANVFDPGSSSLGAELKLRDYPRSDIETQVPTPKLSSGLALSPDNSTSSQSPRGPARELVYDKPHTGRLYIAPSPEPQESSHLQARPLGIRTPNSLRIQAQLKEKIKEAEEIQRFRINYLAFGLCEEDASIEAKNHYAEVSSLDEEFDSDDMDARNRMRPWSEVMRERMRSQSGMRNPFDSDENLVSNRSEWELSSVEEVPEEGVQDQPNIIEEEPEEEEELDEEGEESYLSTASVLRHNVNHISALRSTDNVNRNDTRGFESTHSFAQTFDFVRNASTTSLDSLHPLRQHPVRRQPSRTFQHNSPQQPMGSSPLSEGLRPDQRAVLLEELEAWYIENEAANPIEARTLAKLALADILAELESEKPANSRSVSSPVLMGALQASPGSRMLSPSERAAMNRAFSTSVTHSGRYTNPPFQPTPTGEIKSLKKKATQTPFGPLASINAEPDITQRVNRTASYLMNLSTVAQNTNKEQQQKQHPATPPRKSNLLTSISLTPPTPPTKTSFPTLPTSTPTPKFLPNLFAQFATQNHTTPTFRKEAELRYLADTLRDHRREILRARELCRELGIEYPKPTPRPRSAGHGEERDVHSFKGLRREVEFARQEARRVWRGLDEREVRERLVDTIVEDKAEEEIGEEERARKAGRKGGKNFEGSVEEVVTSEEESAVLSEVGSSDEDTPLLSWEQWL